MKKIFTLIALLITVGAIAQPTVNSSTYPAPGTTLVYTEVNATALSEGSGGANQSWNFSNLTATGMTSTTSYVTASSTPYASSFPGSNLAASTPDGSGGFLYSYYTHSA